MLPVSCYIIAKLVTVVTQMESNKDELIVLMEKVKRRLGLLLHVFVLENRQQCVSTRDSAVKVISDGGPSAGSAAESYLPWLSSVALMTSARLEMSTAAGHPSPSLRMQHLLLSLVTILLPAIRGSLQGAATVLAGTTLHSLNPCPSGVFS